MHDDYRDPVNPYAPPDAPVGRGFELADSNQDRWVREEHIHHEASIKSLGCLFWLGAIFCGLATLGMLASGGKGFSDNQAPGGPSGPMVLLFVVGLYGGLAAIYGVAAYGLRELAPWARIPAGLLCVLGLCGFPIGTLISAYGLYLLFSVKGTTVFSDDYKRVIANTPDVKYKTSPVAIGCLVLLLGFLAVMIVAAVVN